MRYLSIREWDTYQHYKDRSPPWIKLHRSLLTSPTWVSMDDANRVLAVALMLLAAATGNRIMADATYIQRVAYLNRKPDWSKLVSVGFIEIIEEKDGASAMLADASASHTNGTIETETDQSRAEKKDTRHGPKLKTPIDPDRQPDEQDRSFAVERGVPITDEWPRFINRHVAQATLSADWHASWRTWCLNYLKFSAERAAGLGRMGDRQGPSSLVAAARRAAARFEG